MIEIRNPAREGARILHGIENLCKAARGSLWRETPIDQKTMGKNGGNPPYVIATGSENKDTCYIVVALDDGSGYLGPDDTGIFLPGEHQPTFPLIEVTDGTSIVISNKPRNGD